jgi:hypothetical protein
VPLNRKALRHDDPLRIREPVFTASEWFGHVPGSGHRVSPTPTTTGMVFDHLKRLTNDRGLFERAELDEPDPEHGFRLDDVAWALAVVCREPDPAPMVQELARIYLDFTLSALQPDGSCHQRMRADGVWTDTPAPGDWWGRAVWGLGVAAVHGPTPQLRVDALEGFQVAAGARLSPHLRASAFAALGAVEVAVAHPDVTSAEDLLQDAVRAIGTPSPVTVDPFWPWPERWLTYANGALAEALLVAGATLANPAASKHGLRLLDFLLRTETRAGHFSVTPVGGRDRAAEQAGFDQRPIEVACLADACARAFELTGDERWRSGVKMAWAWFLGDNDSKLAMIDPATGAGFDSLERNGRNANQGAESTLAAISTSQRARQLGVFSW